MSVFKAEALLRTIDGEMVQPTRDDPERDLTGVGIDSRNDLTGKAFFAIKGETHDGHDYLHQAAAAGASVLVIERNIATDLLPANPGVIQVESTRKALARLALTHRRSLSVTNVIAVTGSSGKTTTKGLIQSILSQAMTGSCAVRSFNNDIGVPLTLLAAKPSDDYVVVEVGTNAPGEIGMLASIVEPDIAVITNVGRAHLEGLGTVEDVAREKASLLSHLREGGLAIINADNSQLREYAKRAPNVVLFGESEDAELQLTDQRSSGLVSWFEINGRQRFNLSLPGRHNAFNALAAIAVAQRLGVNDEQIQAGLLAAQPEPMRMAIERICDLLLVNDAYNANPDSVIASLCTFGEIAADAGRRVIVLGDMLELGGQGPQLHREVGRAVCKLHAQHPIDELILVGKLVEHIAAEIRDQQAKVAMIHHDALADEVVEEIVCRFVPHDAVLLKGSRRIGLERIAERLCRTRSGSQPPMPVSHHHARNS